MAFAAVGWVWMGPSRRPVQPDLVNFPAWREEPSGDPSPPLQRPALHSGIEKLGAGQEENRNGATRSIRVRGVE